MISREDVIRELEDILKHHVAMRNHSDNLYLIEELDKRISSLEITIANQRRKQNV